MDPSAGRYVKRYGIAAAAVLGSVLIRMAFGHWMGVSLPFITFFLAIVVSVWLGGFGPGILTLVLTAAIGTYYLALPAGRMTLADWAGLFLFLVNGYLICFVVSRLRDTQAKLAAQSENLEGRAELLDLATDAILSAGPDGRIEFWNRGAEAMYGWTSAEALGQVSHELLSTTFPEPLPEILRKAGEAGT